MRKVNKPRKKSYGCGLEPFTKKEKIVSATKTIAPWEVSGAEPPPTHWKMLWQRRQSRKVRGTMHQRWKMAIGMKKAGNGQIDQQRKDSRGRRSFKKIKNDTLPLDEEEILGLLLCEKSSLRNVVAESAPSPTSSTAATLARNEKDL
jgi:hypothetical protein